MLPWDPQKASSNLSKHGISFDEAATVFRDPEGLDRYDDVHADTEPRYQRLATSVMGRVLLVVYTVRRSRSGHEEKRIISARQASRKERAAYSRP
jgi:hypothetical protein